MTRNLLLSSGAAALAATAAQAATLTAIKDTYVDSANGTTNYGSSADLEVVTSNMTTGTSRVAYISFDISGITGPIVSASLDLQKTSGRGNRATGYFGVTDESFDSFDETTLTYDNNPLLPTGAGGDATSLTGDTDLGILQSTTPDRIDGVDPYTSFDDTSNGTDELVDFLNSDTNGIVTFAIRSDSVNGNPFVFASRDNTTPGLFAPTLTVTVIPEPASAAGIGLLGLVGLRRRR